MIAEYFEVVDTSTHIIVITECENFPCLETQAITKDY
jgi:hypothetical protein